MVRLEEKLRKLEEREAQGRRRRRVIRTVTSARSTKHRQDGRYLETGEVVQSSETQASAWRDRCGLVHGSHSPLHDGFNDDLNGSRNGQWVSLTFGRGPQVPSPAGVTRTSPQCHASP